MTVAALYVETGGVYFGLPGVDPWDEARDARLYYVGDDPPQVIHGRGPLGEINSRGNIATAENHHSERDRTPPAFRDVLLGMARSAAKVPA